jgi:subtilisin family serine protease
MRTNLLRPHARLTVALTLAGLACASVYATGGTAGAAPPDGSGSANLAKGIAAKAHSLIGKQIGQQALPRALADRPGARKEPGQSGVPASVPSRGKYAFLLELDTISTLAAYGGASPQGKAAASAAAKAQYRQVQSDQARVVTALPSGSRVLYKMHSVLAGVAVYTDVHNFAALQGISGVKAVYPIAPKSPSNAYAVPLQHAPQAWVAHGDLGENSKVAVIDTGIDYTHANFGGPGTVAAYDTAKSTDDLPPNPALFPSAKVVGGTDLVGDTYNAASADPQINTPAPDPNPLDCGGHGSHVAGTVAGYGENADGTTYAGAYNTSTPFDTMRIGPGVAPQADLLAYKVFGCAGSTSVVAEAIDKAADPNSDGDPSDHVQVINMSLGVDYGSPQDGDSVATNAASNLGISMVVASGNAGDQYDAGGSPGDAVRSISVANSVDAQDQLDTLVVATPASIARGYGSERSAAYNWANGPDLSGTVVALTQADNLDGCGPLSTADAAAVNGKIAFLEWTDDDNARKCGSVARAANVANAGAVGFVFADDAETFSAGITGIATIPGVLVTRSAGNAIRGALQSGPVTVSGTSAADFRQVIPTNNDKVNAGSSRGVRGPGNVKPDVTAVGTGVFSTGVGTGNLGVSESGTSMAAPMVAGLSALVRSLRPAWTPEQVKADIMNTAGQDLFKGPSHTGPKYAPNRVGAGRIQADSALDNTVVAYVQNDPGAVSVSFGPVALAGPVTLTKTVKVQNLGATSATYALAYQAITSVPGVSYHLSPASLTVAAGATRTFTVSFVVTNPAALTKTLDPTVARTVGGIPRDFVADASGRVLLTPSDGLRPTLRVPVYSAPRPMARMTQPASLTLPAGSLQQANMPLSGHGVFQGSGAAQVVSAVAGFELQATSGLAPSCSGSVTSACVHNSDERSADLKYIGVTSDAPQNTSLGLSPLLDGFTYFSITTQGRWRTSAGAQEFDIFIDSTGDSTPDAVLFNTRFGTGDIFVSELVDLATSKIVDIEPIDNRFGDLDTALFDSDTLVMPVAIKALPGVSGAHSRIRYGVASFSNQSAGPVEVIGLNAVTGELQSPLTADVLHPGLAIYGSFDVDTNLLLFLDEPGTTLVTRRQPSTYFDDHAQGALLVHFHNGVGTKAQRMQLKTASHVTLKLSASSIRLHNSMTATVTVANAGSAVPSGLVNIRRVGGGLLRTGRLTNGHVTMSFTPTARGTYQVRADYGGDANYLAGNSPIMTFTVV